MMNISKIISKRNKVLAGSKIEESTLNAGFVAMFITIIESQKYGYLYFFKIIEMDFHTPNSINIVNTSGMIID